MYTDTAQIITAQVDTAHNTKHVYRGGEHVVDCTLTHRDVVVSDKKFFPSSSSRPDGVPSKLTVSVLRVPGCRQVLLLGARTTGTVVWTVVCSLAACCVEQRCQSQARACGVQIDLAPKSEACAWVPLARCAAPDSTSQEWLANLSFSPTSASSASTSWTRLDKLLLWPVEVWARGLVRMLPSRLCTGHRLHLAWDS